MRKGTTVFTKVNTETGQYAHFSPDTKSIPVDIQMKILAELKSKNLLPDEMMQEEEFILNQEIAIIQLFEDWQEIIEFFKTTHIDGQPNYNRQMKAISDKMVPLRNQAKNLMFQWIALKID
jgi:hypothetical protein